MRKQALESLKVNEESNSVMCQKCNRAIPMLVLPESKPRPKSGPSHQLSVKIAIMEKNNTNLPPIKKADADKEIEQLKEELARLERERNPRVNILKRITLQPRTYEKGIKYVCSKCWEKKH